ncbi:hypothetical protein M0802_010912 [Mischocyttarus mexicanus]|nr:hypothetical protein M0802_010912 [Mischocyttarus mexicanus]
MNFGYEKYVKGLNDPGKEKFASFDHRHHHHHHHHHHHRHSRRVSTLPKKLTGAFIISVDKAYTHLVGDTMNRSSWSLKRGRKEEVSFVVFFENGNRMQGPHVMSFRQGLPVVSRRQQQQQQRQQQQQPAGASPLLPTLKQRKRKSIPSKTFLGFPSHL